MMKLQFTTGSAGKFANSIKISLKVYIAKLKIFDFFLTEMAYSFVDR